MAEYLYGTGQWLVSSCLSPNADEGTGTRCEGDENHDHTNVDRYMKMTNAPPPSEHRDMGTRQAVASHPPSPPQPSSLTEERAHGGSMKRKKKTKSIPKKVWHASKRSLKSLSSSLVVLTSSRATSQQQPTRKAADDMDSFSSAEAALARDDSVYFDAADCLDGTSPSSMMLLSHRRSSSVESDVSSTSSGNAPVPRKRSRHEEIGPALDQGANEQEGESAIRVQPVYRGTLSEKYYSSPSTTNLRVRGKTYMDDKVKVPAEEPVMDLVAVDLIEGDEPIHHIAEKERGTARRVLHNADRPLFICNFIVPGATWINFVMCVPVLIGR